MKAKKMSVWSLIRSAMMGVVACLLMVGVLGCAQPATTENEETVTVEEEMMEEAPVEEAAPEAAN
jgi:hypothetical protein